MCTFFIFSDISGSEEIVCEEAANDSETSDTEECEDFVLPSKYNEEEDEFDQCADDTLTCNKSFLEDDELTLTADEIMDLSVDYHKISSTVTVSIREQMTQTEFYPICVIMATFTLGR